jgi:hypothetical protein
MHYTFPKITHINDILPAIEGSPEFIVAERDGYKVVNYMVNQPDTFPEVTDYNSAVRRECRGIIFDTDGNLISRRLHKFFNCGERDETQIDKIDLSKPHVILEKLDGCLTGDTNVITPYGIMSIAEICSIEQPIPVLSYDHSIKKDVWAEVIDTSIKDSVDNWYRITLDDATVLELTDNHKVWCVNKNQYLTIADLEEGDEVLQRED